jgi:hypothetical protein
MLKRLFTERIEFKLEMPIIGWLVLIGYIVVDLLYVLIKVGKMVLGYD